MRAETKVVRTFVVTKELLADAPVDLEQLIYDRLTEEIQRRIDAEFFHGPGWKPEGELLREAIREARRKADEGV